MPETLDDITANLADETVPSLDDFAAEVGGAWSPGWYSAEIIEGFTTKKGKVVETGDDVSKKGDSRNARFCLKVTNVRGDERTMLASFNYRPSDFSAERLDYIKEARKEYAGVQGKWSDSDVQRSSLAVAAIGQFEKALKATVRSKDGMVTPHKAVGVKLDIRLKVDEKTGYNEITAYAESGAKAPKKS